MYNRYIRNDNGTYTRMPEEEPHVDTGDLLLLGLLFFLSREEADEELLVALGLLLIL